MVCVSVLGLGGLLCLWVAGLASHRFSSVPFIGEHHGVSYIVHSLPYAPTWAPHSKCSIWVDISLQFGCCRDYGRQHEGVVNYLLVAVQDLHVL